MGTFRRGSPDICYERRKFSLKEKGGDESVKVLNEN